ncbi:hypothetical protein R5O24_07595 [Tenacibaculum maritimum]|uniref:hypothetical protein n=1 Tax=Tenacibaculum maritimum TaxID=107401 RepID=UPI00388D31BE
MINKRFEDLLEALGENKNSFSKKMGQANNSTIGKIVNGDRQPSYLILNKISVAFPNVNINWLVSGKGNMFNFSYDDLKNFRKEEILDFVIMNVEGFIKEPKAELLIKLLKSKNNQESLEDMHDKIDLLTKQLENLKK